MCEERIEKVLGKVAGVNDADWNVDSKIVTVYYDSTRTTIAALNNAVALSGHETRNARSDSTAYARLPKCCKRPEDM